MPSADTIKRLGCCFGVVFIVAAGLVGGSFAMLDPDEIAILQNKVNRGVELDKVYTGGRYFVGLGKSFLAFPATERNVFFGAGVDTFGSADGPALTIGMTSPVKIEASLQYKIIPAALPTLYTNYQSNYHSRVINIALTALQTTLASLTPNVFYQNRTEVARVSSVALRTALADLNVEFMGFQLRRVLLPNSTEQSIINTIVNEIRQETATNVQAQTNIEAATTVIVGQIQQEVAVFVANKTAEAAVINSRAAAGVKGLLLGAQAKAYAVFGHELHMTRTELLQYLYLKNLASGPASVNIAAGFDAGVIGTAGLGSAMK